MPTLIALITRLDQAEEDAWLEALTATMPNERIVSFRTLDPSQRHDVEIAIVANPDPGDVAALPHLALIQSLWAGVEQLVSELGLNAPPIVRMVDPEMVYRPRSVRHRIESYAASAARGSWFCRMAAGV